MKKDFKSLGQLFGPIFFEILFLMLAGMVDTLMLSVLGDQPVGAVGTANSYIGVFIIMFSVISSGLTAVMTQYIGAGQPGVSRQARNLGMLFNGILGLLMAVGLSAFAGPILRLVGVAPSLEGYAETYLQIVGGGCILNALIPIFSSYLRAFGFTRQPMVATVAGNLVNVAFNALFLFVFHWGVAGVAIATVMCRGVNLLILILESRRLVNTGAHSSQVSNRKVMGQILKVGLPSALETALYNVAMSLIISMLNRMDDLGVNVTARSYTMQITNLSYCAGAALAQANAILTGWRIGAGDFEACDRGTRRAAVTAVGIGIGVEGLFALSSGLIMQLFSRDPEMIALVGRLLAVDIALEAGRATNLVYGNALKTAGDAVFTTGIAAVFTFVCAVGGTYFFGLRLGLLVTGAYIGMAMDECVRALCMGLRWRSGAWKAKRLVSGAKK